MASVVAWNVGTQATTTHLTFFSHLPGRSLHFSSWLVPQLLRSGNSSPVLARAQVNFHTGGSWVPLMGPPAYSHPGQYGASFYYQQLEWQDTVEATKAFPGAAPFWPVPGYSQLDARTGRLVIRINTSCVYMIYIDLLYEMHISISHMMQFCVCAHTQACLCIYLCGECSMYLNRNNTIDGM